MSSSHFYLFADSRYKVNGTNTNFNINLSDQNLQPGVSIAVSVDSLEFYNCQYPINSTNNIIQFSENNDDGTTYTATLTVGNYTGDDLATEIATQFNSATGNAYVYTCTYNGTTGKLSIGGLTLPDVFKITSIDELYGFDVMTTYKVSQEGDRVAILSGYEYVDLLLPSLISENMTNGVNTNGIAKRISLDYSFGSLITYKQMESDQSVIVNKEYLNSLRVELKNPDGTFYNLPDNCYLSLTLKCTFQL